MARRATHQNGDGAGAPNRADSFYGDPAADDSWSLSSLAPAETHRLNGVPFWPDTCFLLMVLHAVVGDVVLPFASLAIAVTH